MITFKQFLTEAISKDSFEGNLPRSEFQKIGRKLAQAGINFDALKFERDNADQFKVAKVRDVYGTYLKWRFSKLPVDFMKTDKKITRRAKRRVITLVTVDPVNHHYVVSVTWGTKLEERAIVYSNDKKIYNDNSFTDAYTPFSQLMNNKDVINYYAYTSSVDVANFTNQRKTHLKEIASRIDDIIKQSSAYKKVQAICAKVDYKLHTILNPSLTEALKFGRVNFFDSEVAGPGGIFDKLYWVVIVTPKQLAKEEYFRKYQWMAACKESATGKLTCTIDPNPDFRIKRVLDWYKRDTPELKEYHDEMFEAWTSVNDKMIKLESDFAKLAQDVRDFIKEQGFNI